MTKLGLKARSMALGVVVALGASGTAGAQPGTIWYFNGNCADCALAAGTSTFAVTATLRLQRYLTGEVREENFVSFYYGGSNLLQPYTVLASGGDYAPLGGEFISGILVPGPQSFELLFGPDLRFTLEADGSWFTCGINGDTRDDVPCDVVNNSDNGNQGGFSTEQAETVPEPTTWALTSVGLAALGFASRRRRMVTR